jgi:hypothetical protein
MCTLFAAPVSRIISPSLLDFGGYHALYTLEMGLALIAFAIIYTLPLTAPPRAIVIQRLDILSYLLLADRLRLSCRRADAGAPVLVVRGAMDRRAASHRGRLPRPGACHRTAARQSDARFPLGAVGGQLADGGRLLLFRFVSSEQSSTAANLYQQLGLLNDQTITLYAVILLASLVGGLFCTLLMTTRYVETAHLLALVLIAAGAYLDSQSTSLTRPEQMYLSQALVAAGAAMFLPPVMASGFKAAMARGMPFIVNFLAIFLFTQSIGSLFASAMLGTFVTIREKFHSNVLVEHILLQDPLVAQRVSQLAAAYGKVITDKTLLSAEGIALLGQQVTREAYILAYNDTFLVICLASFWGWLFSSFIRLAAASLA